MCGGVLYMCDGCGVGEGYVECSMVEWVVEEVSVCGVCICGCV